MNVSTLMAILELAGTDTPAFIALYNQVVQSLSSDDQTQLKLAYEAAQAASDEQHSEAQAD
jgi:hypothetical protein